MKNKKRLTIIASLSVVSGFAFGVIFMHFGVISFEQSQAAQNPEILSEEADGDEDADLDEDDLEMEEAEDVVEINDEFNSGSGSELKDEDSEEISGSGSLTGSGLILKDEDSEEVSGSGSLTGSGSGLEEEEEEEEDKVELPYVEPEQVHLDTGNIEIVTKDEVPKSGGFIQRVIDFILGLFGG